MKTVFYDGKCGLCRREIAYYQKIAAGDQFDWVDITQDASRLTTLGVSYADGLELLHVQDEHGILHKGVDAFIQIWSVLKYWRVLATITRLAVIYPLAEKVYALFAAWRFRRLAHCQLAASKKGHEVSSPKLTGETGG